MNELPGKIPELNQSDNYEGVAGTMKKLVANVNSLLNFFVNLDIRAKIIGLVFGLVTLLGTVTTLYTYSTTSRHLDQELYFESTNITKDLVEAVTPLLLTGDNASVQELLNETLRDHPAVRYAFILDAQGNVLYHAFTAGPAAANNITLDSQTQIRVLATDNGSVWDVANPIFYGQAGTVRIGVGDEQKKTLLGVTLREQLLVTGIVVIAGLAVAFLLGSFISAQIKALVQAARIVTGGDIGHQAKVYSHDDLGRLAQAFNTMSTNLARMRDKLEQKEVMQRQLLITLITAQEGERLRVARDLHDNMGGSLSSLGYGLQSALLTLETDHTSVKPLLRHLYEENLSVQDELRATVYALRPSVLDDLGLMPALRSYAEHCVTTKGVDVDFSIEGEERRLPSEIETALFRITQEALNNTLRHAAAHKVRVYAKFEDGGVGLTITDDGCGFDAAELLAKPDGRAIGLMGMRERAELLEGELEVASKPGKGCLIRVYVPTVEHKDG